VARDLRASMGLLPGLVDSPTEGAFVDLVRAIDDVYPGHIEIHVFPMTRSLDASASPKPGLAVLPLARTSDTSWAETDLVSLFEKQTAKFGEGDIKGPVTVALAIEANLEQLKRGKGTARMVVFGDTDFAANQFIENFFNRDFIMNSIDWLAGEANAISIRPRTLRASRFSLTISEFDAVFVLSVLLLPELLLIIGITVWWERRN
jgi:ABC-type uncharacterized transport system involved in gliding motility auxiliary subunit